MATATPAAPSKAQESIQKAQAAVDANKDGEKKGRRASIDSWTSTFKSADEAEAEAKKRASGPKRAFKVKLTKAIPAGEYYVVAHNNHEACTPLCKQQFGAEIEEIGKAARAPRSNNVTPEQLERLKEEAKTMTPERKAELKKQMEALQALLK